MRAYAKTRVYMNETPAAEIARAEKSYFPDIDEQIAVLEDRRSELLVDLEKYD